MEDQEYLSTVNLEENESSSDSLELEDLSHMFASSTVSKPKSNKVKDKSLDELQLELKDLAEGIKRDNISQINFEEKLKQMKIEKPCEDEKKPIESIEKKFTIFCVNDSLQFFNSRDVTPLLCGYDNRSEELTSIEKDLLTYVRVELESALSSFLLTCHPCSISDCKSFVNFLLYHISVSNDPACINACYHRLLLILSEHPHAHDISFSSAEIFMLLFNYGIDVENCQLLEQRPGIKRHLGAPKCKNKSSNKIPNDWTYNLKIMLESFIELVSICDFKPKELCNILLFLTFMSLDSTLLKKKFHIIIQDTISACIDNIAEDKWTTILYEFSNVLLSLKFASENEKWNNIYNMIELFPHIPGMCIHLRRHVSFLALKLLCGHSEVDLNLSEFSLEEFKTLLRSLDHINSEITLSLCVKFIDLCLSHLHADEEDFIELCNVIKQTESALPDIAHVAKSHILKIHSRLKIMVGKVSSWLETSLGIKIKEEILEKTNVTELLKVKKEPNEFPNDSSSKDENKVKIRRLSENMYYVASIDLDENVDNPELPVPHPDSAVLEVENVNNCNENYAVGDLRDFSKVVEDCIMIDKIIPEAEFSENNIVVTSLTSFADNTVDVEEPATFKLEKINDNSDYNRTVEDCVMVDGVAAGAEFGKNNIVVASVMSCASSSLEMEQSTAFNMKKVNSKSEGHSKITEYECDLVNNVVPQDEFSESNIVVASVSSCADNSVDVEQSGVFQLEKIRIKSENCNQITGYECDIAPQDEFAESNIVVASVKSCAGSVVDVKQPIIFKVEKMIGVESTSCHNSFLIQDCISNFVENSEPSNELTPGLNILASEEAFGQETDFNTDSSINCTIIKNPTLMETEIHGEPEFTFNETKALNYSTVGSPVVHMTSSIEPEPDASIPIIKEIKSISSVTVDLEKESSVSSNLIETYDTDVIELPVKDNFFHNAAQNNPTETLGLPSLDLDSALNANMPSANQFKTTSLTISPQHPFMASPKLEEFIPLAVGESAESVISHMPALDGPFYNPHNVRVGNGGLFKTEYPRLLNNTQTPDLLKSVSSLGIAKKLIRHSHLTESRSPETLNEILTRNTESLLQQIDKDLGLDISSRPSQHSASVDLSNGDEIVFIKEVESPTKSQKSKDCDKQTFSTPIEDLSDQDPQIIFVKKVDSPFKNKNNSFSVPFQKDSDVYAKSSHEKVRKEEDIIFLEEKHGKPVKQKPSANISKINSEENKCIDNIKQWFPKTSSELQILPVDGVQNFKSSRSSSTDFELEKLRKNSSIEISLSSVSTSNHSTFSKPSSLNDDNDIIILKEVYSPCKKNKNQSVTLISLDDAKHQLNNVKSKSEFFSSSLAIESIQINEEPFVNANIEDLNDLTPVQVEDECVIPEENQSDTYQVVSELVHQLIEKVPDFGVVYPEIDEISNEKVSFDNAVSMDVKSKIKVVSKNEKYFLSHENDDSDSQLKTEIVNHSDISKQKYSSLSVDVFESDEIMCTDTQLNSEDPLLNVGDVGVVSENRSSSEDMYFHNIEKNQDNIADPEVVNHLNYVIRQITSPNELDIYSKSSNIFKISVKPKENPPEKDLLNSSLFSDSSNEVSLSLNDLNISNSNDEKENTELEELKDPTVVRVQKCKVAKMSVSSAIPLISANHCVKTCSSVNANALNTNTKSVTVLNNDQNKVLNSVQTECTRKTCSSSVLSSTSRKLNRKRKNSECSNSFSKVQKVTNLKTEKNSNIGTSGCFRSVKSSLCKQKFVSPKKSKLFVPTHYRKKKTSPFKSNFKTSPKKSTMLSKALLKKRGLALSQYLRNKVMSSSSEQIPKSAFHISDSDSNSDVEILYCDPKKYSDSDCIILYESEDVVVLD